MYLQFASIEMRWVVMLILYLSIGCVRMLDFEGSWLNWQQYHFSNLSNFFLIKISFPERSITSWVHGEMLIW